MTVAITPTTKVGALLEAYPGIEDALIAWVPAFSKLKNPILRRTVAKVATLEQAASVAGISVRDLVLHLRKATGQEAAEEFPVLNNLEAERQEEAPEWVTGGSERAVIDAEAMLASGRHPLGEIQRQLAACGDREYIRLTSGFRPAPLFETMRAAGVRVYWRKVAEDRHETLLARPAGG